MCIISCFFFPPPTPRALCVVVYVKCVYLGIQYNSKFLLPLWEKYIIHTYYLPTNPFLTPDHHSFYPPRVFELLFLFLFSPKTQPTFPYPPFLLSRLPPPPLFPLLFSLFLFYFHSSFLLCYAAFFLFTYIHTYHSPLFLFFFFFLFPSPFFIREIVHPYSPVLSSPGGGKRKAFFPFSLRNGFFGNLLRFGGRRGRGIGVWGF